MPSKRWCRQPSPPSNGSWLTGDHDIAVERAQLTLDRFERIAWRRRSRGQQLRWLRRLDADRDVDVGTGPPDEFTAGVRGDWRSAAAAFQRLGDRYAWALELVDSREHEPMLEALRVLDQLGAVAIARLVRGRLRALGATTIPRGPQTRTRANPAGLTPREMDVLSLVSHGFHEQ